MRTDTETRLSSQAPDLLCRSCQSPMALRNGKHGLFYGCTSYPLCKVTLRFNDVSVKPSPKDLEKAKLSTCYRGIKPGSKLRVESKRTKVRGAWTTVSRFTYV